MKRIVLGLIVALMMGIIPVVAVSAPAQAGVTCTIRVHEDSEVIEAGGYILPDHRSHNWRVTGTVRYKICNGPGIREFYKPILVYASYNREGSYMSCNQPLYQKRVKFTFHFKDYTGRLFRMNTFTVPCDTDTKGSIKKNVGQRKVGKFFYGKGWGAPIWRAVVHVDIESRHDGHGLVRGRMYKHP